jgi:hypothetical protein
MSRKSEVEKLLSDHGFNIEVDNDGKVSLEPGFLQLEQIDVRMVRRGRYIADPALVPPELQDKNILWIDEPPVVTATTKNGNEINVYVTQVVTHFEEIHPDDGR